VHAAARATPPLVFGIYPGGAAGTVGPSGPVKPEDPVKRLAALQQLRASGVPFVLHLYASYTGPGTSTPAQQVGADIASYASAGFQIELVLTYRPADNNASVDVPGFAAFTRATVDAFGSNPGFVSLQVTNEANQGGAPNAADGYYNDVQDALIQGVIAAKAETRTRGYSQVAVGFNWAYATDGSQSSFWKALAKGGSTFRSSVDWVGLDVYPGTWGPVSNGSDLASTTATTMLAAISALRSKFMPLAGLASSVPMRIAENGYPTGPGRTEAMQTTVLQTSIGTVDANRAAYNITGYRWFDLRDADSSSSSFESQYGLLHDDYTPKAAFPVYKSLVATFGGPH
jgi:hypothetical protein